MANNSKKTQVFPKVIGKRYAVKVNGQSVFYAPTRKEALTYISGINLADGTVQNVQLVNETTTEKVIQSLIPQTNVVTLVASDLGPSITE